MASSPLSPLQTGLPTKPFPKQGSLFVIVQLLSHIQLFATTWIAACQTSLSITKSQSLHKFMSTEPKIPSNHLIFCHPLLLLSSVFPSITIFSSESVLFIRLTFAKKNGMLPVQFSSVTQSCPTLCDSMDCSMPGFPVHHQLQEFTQTHVH